MRMRAKRNNGRRKENTEIRKGIARHPGLDMFDTRVSDTRKRLTGLMTQEENNTETCNEKKDKQKNGREKDTKKTTAQQKNRHRKLEKGGRQPGKHEASHNPTNLLKEDARCIKC